MRRKTSHHLLMRVLVIMGVVAVLPLAAGFLLIEHSAKTRLSDAAATNFVWFAEHAATSVEITILREFEYLAAVARSPMLSRELIEAGTLAGRGTEELMNRAGSRYLAELERASSLYRELTLFDTKGFVVAASETRERMSAAEEAGLQSAISKARARSGSVDIWALLGPDAGVLTLYRSARDVDSGELVGIIHAELDTERLFRGISDLRFGETGHACLIDRRSGRVVARSLTDCSDEGTYSRFEDFTRARTQGNRYFLSDVAGPASFDRAEALLVAYASPDLEVVLPGLRWVVTVEQSLNESLAPLVSMGRDLILYFLGMGVLVVVLAAYASYKLEKPLTDVELDLHPD